MNFENLNKIINNKKSFIITTHVNPDADAIGSEIALYRFIKKFNKQVRIINYSTTPYNLNFLDSENVIEIFDDSLHSTAITDADVIFLLDLNNLSRTVSMKDIIEKSSAIKICIDHHQNPEEFADYYFVDENYSSTGEIILDYFKPNYLNLIKEELSIPLYAAIMTDTGSFRFERTSAKLHRDVAFLIERGANPVDIYDKIYEQNKLSKLQLLSRAFNSINFLANGRLAYMTITKKDFAETKALESDTDNFVNYNLSIEGVVLGILFIELKNGFKVNFRSKGNIRVDLIAKYFGGGGHKNAAGARFYNKILNDEIKSNILDYSITALNSKEE